MTDVFDYDEAKADADAIIAEFGQSGYIRRPTFTGSATAPVEGAPTNHPATFVIIDYTNREIDGTRILVTDRRALVAKGDLSIDIALTDELIDAASVKHKIISVKPLAPAGTVVLYDLQVRR